jgi:hypothetical protein
MPVLLSCTSGSATDSLPRSNNIKRSTSALHRLQQRKGVLQPDIDGEFGNLAQSQRTERPLPFARKSFNILRHKKSNQGLSSADLPPASSDLQSDEQATAPILLEAREISNDREQAILSEGEDEEKPESFFKGMVRSPSFSPSKANRLSKIIAHFDIDNRPSTPSPPSSRTFNARKRVVNIATIGNPTNFQHTSHLGGASDRAKQGEEQAEQLQKQILEVTAALEMGDGDEGFIVKDHIPSEGSSISEASSESITSGESSPIESESKAAPSIVESSVTTPAEGEATSLISSPPSSPSKEQQKVELSRHASKRKPVPKTRGLADLCDVFKNQVSEEEEPSQQSYIEVDTKPDSAKHTNTVDEQVPTIRANNNKRLVPGPAGDLITDTANGRWNCALDEIKKALKAEGDEDDTDVDETLVDVMQRADLVLARLDVL